MKPMQTIRLLIARHKKPALFFLRLILALYGIFFRLVKRHNLGVLFYEHQPRRSGAIVLRRPWRRILNCGIKDKILFKSLIDKCQPVQKLNRITGDDRRFASPPAAAKLPVVCSCFLSKE